MSPTHTTRANRRFAIDVCAVILTLIAAAGAVVASAEEASAANDKVSFSTGKLAKSGAAVQSKATKDAAPRSKSRDARLQALDTGFWFFDASVELFFDDDEDGYFYGLDVYFDADSDFADVNVYARLYLSLDGGPWEEYYATGDFKISGATGDDEFVVQTELFENYPTGLYDVLIELYDADFDEFVAEIGPAETSALSLLPLEDQQKDAPVVIETVIVTGSGGGGGALGWPILPLGIACLWWRRRA